MRAFLIHYCFDFNKIKDFYSEKEFALPEQKNNFYLYSLIFVGNKGGNKSIFGKIIEPFGDGN